jgi:hypothetical protein
MRALGHASLSSTQVYLHVSDLKLAKRLRSAIAVTPDDGDPVRRLVRDELETLLRAAQA